MPYYLCQLSYTKEAIKTLDEHPQNRFEAVRSAYEELGVTIREAFLAFGDYDVVFFIEAPDNVRAAAVSLASTAGGAIAHYKTTPLLTWDEGVEAMRIAGGSSYTPSVRCSAERERALSEQTIRHTQQGPGLLSSALSLLLALIHSRKRRTRLAAGGGRFSKKSRN